MRERGILIWFDEDKGYGFIRRQNGEEIFVHKTAFRGGHPPLLFSDDPVEFTTERGKKGLRAVDVIVNWEQKEGLPQTERPPRKKPRVQQAYFAGQGERSEDSGSRPEVKIDAERSPLPDFLVAFDPSLTESQVKAAFEALADYFRACGGAGLAVRFEYEHAEALEPTHA